jgi:hypothetical protein
VPGGNFEFKLELSNFCNFSACPPAQHSSQIARLVAQSATAIDRARKKKGKLKQKNILIFINKTELD